MPDIALTDPLGRRIVLHDHTWFGHVVKGHPEMRRRRVDAEDAVIVPTEIRFSLSDPDCRIYYGTVDATGVAVAVVANVIAGFVKTAYLAAKRKGDVEWSESKP